jgi:endoglucanase
MLNRRQFIALSCPVLAACAAPSSAVQGSASPPGASAGNSSNSGHSASAASLGSAACPWPAWETFRNRFMQADGRVIDFSANDHSTSEGQAYGLFFALVANDRKAFDLILNWARTNLAGGDLTARLMAWHWGKKPDGSWGVLDNNAASDADLWLAYTLYQAAHLWRDASLRASAELLQARIEKELIVQIAGIGPVLLPGPQGFALKSGGWKLNPSYLPLTVLYGLQREAPRGPWQALAKSTLAMFDAITPQLLVADWVAFRPKMGFVLDPEVGVTGSYDAIRAYMWAGMMVASDPARGKLLARMRGMLPLLEKHGVPPHRIHTGNGTLSDGAGPLGFSAALLPFLAASGAQQLLETQRKRISAGGGLPAIYYEQALGLFALGFLEKRFQFARDGKLVLSKQAVC